MVFVACGLNHKTAPLEMREKIAFVPERHQEMLCNLMDLPSITEATLLSTCNRTEIYCDTNDPDQLGNWLAFEHNIPIHQLQPHLYQHHAEDGVRHTLRVASGLDSMMLGEPQILGQLKHAYQLACQQGTVKSTLRSVFEYVFSASKRVRNLSGIGCNPVSIAYAAVQLITQQFKTLKELNVLLIGSGETSSLVAKYLHQAGVERFIVTSRTHDNALKLATQFSGKTLNIGDIPNNLHTADVVISATACPLPFINKSLVEHAMERRHQKPMFFLDLAVPRDIEAIVATINDVHLFNIDDLQKIIETGMDQRRSCAMQAEQLIESELDNYIRWHRSLRADELICTYRKKMQAIAELEIKRAMQKLNSEQSHEKIINELSHRLVNKLSHHTTVGFRRLAKDAQLDALELANYVFNLSDSGLNHEEVS